MLLYFNLEIFNLYTFVFSSLLAMIILDIKLKHIQITIVADYIYIYIALNKFKLSFLVLFYHSNLEYKFLIYKFKHAD